MQATTSYVYVAIHALASTAIGPVPLRGGLKNVNNSTSTMLICVAGVVRACMAWCMHDPFLYTASAWLLYRVVPCLWHIVEPEQKYEAGRQDKVACTSDATAKQPAQLCNKARSMQKDTHGTRQDSLMSLSHQQLDG